MSGGFWTLCQRKRSAVWTAELLGNLSLQFKELIKGGFDNNVSYKAERYQSYSIKVKYKGSEQNG